MSDDTRRLGVFWIGERDLLALMGSARGTTFTVNHNIPEGATLVSVHHDWQRQAWGLVVEHESMPLGVPGDHIPWVGGLNLRIEPLPPDVVREIEDATRLAAPVPPDVIKRLEEIRDQLIADAESVVGKDATWPEGWPCEPVIVEGT